MVVAGTLDYGSVGQPKTHAAGETPNPGKYNAGGRNLSRYIGPAVICVIIALYLLGVRFIFWDAVDRTSMHWKSFITSCALAGLVSFSVCSSVDPGRPERDPLDPGPADDSTEELRTRRRNLPDGSEFLQRYCRDCQVWRPHRCGHCHFCGQCVLRLDHHCHVVGACIGERNQRFFMAFLAFIGVALMSTAGLLAHCLYDLHWWAVPAAGTPHHYLEWWFVLMNAGIGLTFFTFSLFLICVMVADMDIHKMRGGWKSAKNELSKFGSCAGFVIYCCAPLSFGKRLSCCCECDASTISPPGSPRSISTETTNC